MVEKKKGGGVYRSNKGSKQQDCPHFPAMFCLDYRATKVVKKLLEMMEANGRKGTIKIGLDKRQITFKMIRSKCWGLGSPASEIIVTEVIENVVNIIHEMHFILWDRSPLTGDKADILVYPRSRRTRKGEHLESVKISQDGQIFHTDPDLNFQQCEYGNLWLEVLGMSVFDKNPLILS